MMMTVDGNVLLTGAPDWSQPVEYERRWRTLTETTLKGGEVREALQTVPRRFLRWRVITTTPAEQNRVTNEINAALEAGGAATPIWGRGIPVLAANGTTLQLGNPVWFDTRPEDRVWIAAPGSEDGQLVKVLAASGNTLTVETVTGNVTGKYVWPILLGRLQIRAVEQRTNWRGYYDLEILELVGREPLPPIEALITFDYLFDGTALQTNGTPAMSFDHQLDGVPLLNGLH